MRRSGVVSITRVVRFVHTRRRPLALVRTDPTDLEAFDLGINEEFAATPLCIEAAVEGICEYPVLGRISFRNADLGGGGEAFGSLIVRLAGLFDEDVGRLQSGGGGTGC